MTRPWSVHVGDCRHILAAMPEESIDACVTDTPYGLSTLLDPPNLGREALWQKLTAGQREAPIRTLMRSWLDTGENPVMKGRGFMGKEWDALVPPPNTWAAAFRVLKPGAALLALGGTRTHDLITMAIRTACFVLMVVVDGWLRWVFLAGAAFLPYVAVVLANARAPRTPGTVTPVVPRADDVRYLQP